MASSIDAAAVAGITCGRCGATPGHRCVTVRGAAPGTPKSYPCSERTAALYDVWRSAFAEGMAQQADIIRQRLRVPGGYGLTEDQIDTLCRKGWSS